MSKKLKTALLETDLRLRREAKKLAGHLKTMGTCKDVATSPLKYAEAEQLEHRINEVLGEIRFEGVR